MSALPDIEENDDRLAFIAALANRYGSSVEAVLAELSGDTALAKLVRDLFGLSNLPPLKATKRGRKAKADENWRLFVLIEVARRNGAKLGEAIQEYIDQSGGENAAESRVDTVRRQYTRLKKQWKRDAVPEGFAALFSSKPELGT